MEEVKASYGLQLIKSRWAPAQHQGHTLPLPHSPCVLFFCLLVFCVTVPGLTSHGPGADLQPSPFENAVPQGPTDKHTLAYGPQRLY